MIKIKKPVGLTASNLISNRKSKKRTVKILFCFNKPILCFDFNFNFSPLHDYKTAFELEMKDEKRKRKSPWGIIILESLCKFFYALKCSPSLILI